MDKTTVKRTSVCLTKETERQLNHLRHAFGENTSQVISRAIHIIHFSLRFPNVKLSEILEETKHECNGRV